MFEFLPEAATKVSNSSTRKNQCRPRVEELEDRCVPVTSVTDLTGALTPNNLVQALVGPGVTFSNVQYTGADEAAGTFSGGLASVGIGSGVVLSTGSAAGVVGPNDDDSFSNTNGTAGDSDLDLVTDPNPTEDAAVLEFDFVPTGGTLTFFYVFGSDEYPDYAPPNNAAYNDAFAFYLNGTNVALIPSTTTPVSINTINPVTNEEFYVDNTGATRNTQMNGFTTVLKVTAQVNANQSNHIKLVIADVGDSSFDSNVLIKSASFSAPVIPTIKIYRPLRYTYNSTTKVYTGKMTVIASQNIPGPVYLLFPNMPSGVTLANKSGVSAGVPYLKISAGLKKNVSTLVTVSFTNPSKAYISTYFLKFDVTLALTV